MRRRSFLTMLGLAPVSAAGSFAESNAAEVTASHQGYARLRIGYLPADTVLEFKDCVLRMSMAQPTDRVVVAVGAGGAGGPVGAGGAPLS